MEEMGNVRQMCVMCRANFHAKCLKKLCECACRDGEE